MGMQARELSGAPVPLPEQVLPAVYLPINAGVHAQAVRKAVCKLPFVPAAMHALLRHCGCGSEAIESLQRSVSSLVSAFGPLEAAARAVAKHHDTLPMWDVLAHESLVTAPPSCDYSRLQRRTDAGHWVVPTQS